MEPNQFLSPDHYLAQGSRDYTPPHSYPQIIVPLQNLEQQWVRRMADLMEWSIGDPGQGANLSFLMEQTFQQFGDCFDMEHGVFFRNLNGNLAEGGNVPGYPVSVYLQHLDVVLPHLWPQYVTIFRHMAIETYALLQMFLSQNQTTSFVFHKWVPGGLVFLMTPRTQVYDIG